MIELSQLAQSFDGVRILDQISIALPERGSIALMGSSGAGKTSLLKILAGISKPESGSIRGLEKKRICLMFQEDRLLPWYSALKNVMLAMSKENEEEARNILQRLGIEQADALPSALSGGMKRRVALARAIAFHPDVMLLDEPFSGIDAETRKVIAPFVRQSSPLIVFATHDIDDAALMGADRILNIHNCRLYEAE